MKMKLPLVSWFLAVLVCASLSSCSFPFSGSSSPEEENLPLLPPVATLAPIGTLPAAAPPQAAAPPPPTAGSVTLAPTTPPPPVIQNPGFENGPAFFDSWTELPATFQYGGQSVDEATIRHSGGHSRKLFLRYGGSYIIQRIPVDPPLPLNSQLTLSVFVLMPFPGDKTNKDFSLELVIGYGTAQTKNSRIDVYDAMPNWTQLSVTIVNATFPITWVELHAMTNNGNGLYHGFDKPAYVDDFALSVVPGQP